MGNTKVVFVTNFCPHYRVKTFELFAQVFNAFFFKEPWGLVVNETMNQGVPAIATDAVGAAAGGLVQHGQTGLVVAERDVEALAAALQQLLADPTLRARPDQVAPASGHARASAGGSLLEKGQERLHHARSHLAARRRTRARRSLRRQPGAQCAVLESSPN